MAQGGVVVRIVGVSGGSKKWQEVEAEAGWQSVPGIDNGGGCSATATAHLPPTAGNTPPLQHKTHT